MAYPTDTHPATLHDRLQVLRRHRLPALLTLAGGVVATLLLALLLPPTYRSTATILIEQQQIPQDLVRSTVTSFADERVQVIGQRVMTSSNLMDVINRYDLYPWERRNRAREAVIEKMRDDIHTKMISANVVDPRSGRPVQATIAFTVAYESRYPDLALKVASELTTLYLNENLTMRTDAARQTAQFLGEEANQLRGDIQAASEKLSAFKAQHRTALPDMQQSNGALLDRTETELRDVTNRLAALDQQRVLLEAQLTQISPTAQIYSETGQRIVSPADRLKALKAQLSSLKALYAPGHPDITRTEREIAGLEKEVGDDDGANDVLRQIEATRAELAAARERYSADHPDVVRLQHKLESLDAQVKDAPAASRVKAALANPDNPPYVQLKSQLDSLGIERQSLLSRAESIRGKLDELQGRLSRSPDVERQYLALLREVDNAQLKYQEVRAKQREAESAQNLETERKGERFTLIEPPLPPEQPVSPNRPAVLAFGLVGSVLLTLLVVGLRESLAQTVRGVGDIARLLEVPPLIAIPVIPTPADDARRGRAVRVGWQGTLGAVLVVAVLVHLLVRPLDLVWMALLRRFGL